MSKPLMMRVAVVKLYQAGYTSALEDVLKLVRTLQSGNRLDLPTLEHELNKMDSRSHVVASREIRIVLKKRENALVDTSQ